MMMMSSLRRFSSDCLRNQIKHTQLTLGLRQPNNKRGYCSNHQIMKTLQSPHNRYPKDFKLFSFLMDTCAQSLSQYQTGQSVHAAAIRLGFVSDPRVQSRLIFMYAKLGLLDFAHQVFAEIPDPDLETQTTMVVICCSQSRNDFEFARALFDKNIMPHNKDPIAWNAMVSGHVLFGQSLEALNLFHLMQIQGVEFNEDSAISVLLECPFLGALDHGRWIHGCIERSNLPMTAKLGTALTEMYAKCGDMDKAMDVFWGIKQKNVSTWNSALNGLEMNGFGDECLRLYSLMKHDQLVQPDSITFFLVLRGCSDVGLVDEGLELFDSMKKVYGFEPQLSHCCLVVDLFCQAGRLDEALDFIQNMPVESDPSAWKALLSACKTHGNTELGELASRKIVELEAKSVRDRINHPLFWNFSTLLV